MRWLLLCFCLVFAGCSQSQLSDKWRQWTSYENLYDRAMSWAAKRADCTRLHYQEYRNCKQQYLRQYHAYQQQRRQALVDGQTHRHIQLMLDSPTPIPRHRPVTFRGYAEFNE